MMNILYDIYSIPLKDNSRKNILKQLNNETSTYALITKDRISFSNKGGISYPDYVIDTINERSFIFISKVQTTVYYLLIYINGVILYSGLVTEAQMSGKMDLYKSELPEEIQYYTNNYESEFSFLPTSIERQIDITIETNFEKYEFDEVATIKNKLQRPYKIASVLLGVIIVAGLIFYGSDKYLNYEHELAVKQNIIHQINTWKSYRNALLGNSADAQLNAVFQRLSFVRKLPNFAVRSFTYSNNQLTVQLVNFGYPTLLFQKLATKNHFTETKLTENQITLSKPIKTVVTKSNNTIVNAVDVKAWLIDQVQKFSTNMTISFGSEVSASNYQVIPVVLTVNGVSIQVIKAFLHLSHQLPIRLTSITGSTTLGSFTGSINMNIIGGIS